MRDEKPTVFVIQVDDYDARTEAYAIFATREEADAYVRRLEAEGKLPAVRDAVHVEEFPLGEPDWGGGGTVASVETSGGHRDPADFEAVRKASGIGDQDRALSHVLGLTPPETPPPDSIRKEDEPR